MADESLDGQTPWLEDVLGPIIVDGNGNQLEPRTAGLYFVGATIGYDAVRNVRTIAITGTGGTGLPSGTAANQLMRWNGSEAVFTLMTAAMHGEQSDGALHEVATVSKAGFASPAMVQAINGISSTIQSAVDSLTTLINQKMNAFGIGVIDATLSAGTVHVPATLPSGAQFFHEVTAHSDYEGLITVTGNTTGIDVSSSNPLDTSTVRVLWIKL